MKHLLIPTFTNANGRTYPRKVLEEIVEKHNKGLPDGGLYVYYGELYHENMFAEVDLSEISHTITALELLEDGLYGDINILDTPAGKILKAGLDNRVFRPRGLGVVDKANNVLPGYHLVTFDAMPVAVDAYSDLPNT